MLEPLCVDTVVNALDGTACGTGQVCSAGACVAAGGGGTSSCSFALDATAICSEYTALSSGDAALLQAECTGSGTWSSSAPCSTASRVPGFCARTRASPSVSLKTYYYSTLWTPASAQSSCTTPFGGTWNP